MKLMEFAPAQSRVRIFLMIIAVLALSSLGCSNSHDLTLTSLDHHQSYSQGFTRAYASRNGNGDVDLVLIDQAMENALNQKPDATPVRQAMHIRLVWSPTRDMKAVTSNASVKWFVIGRSRPQDLLDYSGIAFVSLQDDDSTMTFNFRNAQLNPAGPHGNLIDPVGKSQLEGAITAAADPDAVQKVLAQIQSAIAAAGKPVPLAAR